MKKKLLAFIIGITTAFSAIPAVTAQALDPPIPGDANLDWTINIADLLCMQKYIMGAGTLDNTFGIINVDINRDNEVDIFDYIELKKIFEKQYGLDTENPTKIESKITPVDSAIPLGVIYAPPSSVREAVISSVEELEYYLSPYNVITTDGECVFIDVASQEFIDDMLARYNDEFFNKNVLLLNYLPEHSEFESIKYEGEQLVIKYYKTDYISTDEPTPPYIAEVAVPKGLWADSCIWEETEKSSVELAVKSDFTNAITSNAIKSAYSTPVLIKNAEELDTYLDGKFHAGVELSLKETYNDEFFAENMLVIDLYYQHSEDDWETYLTAEKDVDSNIVLTYSREFINGFVDTGIQINQIVFPKDQYCASISKKSWRTPAEVSYTSVDLFTLSEINNFETEYGLSKKGEWVNSAEEMRSYLSECVSGEMLEYLLNQYSADWESESVYMWIDSDVIGSSENLIDSAISDNRLELTLSKYQPLSCITGDFLHIIRTDKIYSGKSVDVKSINTNELMPRIDGEYSITQFGTDIVMVNQYTFGDKNIADIYRLYPGGGPAEFSGYDYIGTIELANGYSITDDSENITFASNNDIFMDASRYSIKISGDKLTISYKYSADSDITEKTFDY